MYVLILQFKEKKKHPFAVTYVIPPWNSMGFLYKQEILPGKFQLVDGFKGCERLKVVLIRFPFFFKITVAQAYSNSNNLKYFLIYILDKQGLPGNVRRCK